MKNLSLLLSCIWGFLLVSCSTDGNEVLSLDEHIESVDSIPTLPLQNGDEETDVDTVEKVAVEVNRDETDEWGE